MYGQVDQSQTQRKKLIIVSIIMGIIILVLAAVLVDGIMKKNAKVANLGEVTNDPAELDENNSEPSHGEAENAEDSNLNPVSNAEDGSSSAAGTTNSSAEAESSSETASEIASTAASLPQTGAHEVLSLALLLGSVVTFLGSKVYLKDLA